MNTQDLESCVIGSLLIGGASPDAFEVISTLPEEAFSISIYRQFYAAIRDQLLTENLIDPVMLAERFNHSDAAFLAECAKNTFSCANLRGYVDRVAKAHQKRLIISAVKNGNIALNEARTDAATDQAVSEILQQITDATADSKSISPVDSVVLLDNYVDMLQSRNEGTVKNLTFGMQAFDDQSSGIDRTDLVVIAARPSMGKTEFAISAAKKAAQSGGVLMFSMEMSAIQITERRIAAAGNLELSTLKNPGDLRDEDWAKISIGMQQLTDSKFWIVDATNLTVEQIRAIAEKHKRKHPELNAIFVDYIGLIKKPKAERNDLAIGHISSSLKNMAKQLNTPVIALSQLSRDVEKRPNKRPINSDLRDSGSVEQDADLIVMLYRDEYYNSDSHAKGIAEAIITKNRNGKTGTVYFEFRNGHFYETDQARAHELSSHKPEPLRKRYSNAQREYEERF